MLRETQLIRLWTAWVLMGQRVYLYIPVDDEKGGFMHPFLSLGSAPSRQNMQSKCPDLPPVVVHHLKRPKGATLLLHLHPPTRHVEGPGGWMQHPIMCGVHRGGGRKGVVTQPSLPAGVATAATHVTVLAQLVAALPLFFSLKRLLLEGGKGRGCRSLLHRHVRRESCHSF